MSTGLPAASAASRNAVRSGITTARTCPSPSNPASETDTSPGGVYVGGSAYVVSRNVESHSPYSCARAGRLPYRHRGTARSAGDAGVAVDGALASDGETEGGGEWAAPGDRKSTRLNSSHV